MGEQKDDAESAHEGTRLARELAGGDLQFRWAETFPPTALSARSEKEVAKHQSPSTLLSGENVQRHFFPSSWTFNQGLLKGL